MAFDSESLFCCLSKEDPHPPFAQPVVLEKDDVRPETVQVRKEGVLARSDRVQIQGYRALVWPVWTILAPAFEPIGQA